MKRWQRVTCEAVTALLMGLGGLSLPGAAWGRPGGEQPPDGSRLTSFFSPSAQYTPGVAVRVGLEVTQFPWGTYVRVEDAFPAGWAVSGISHSGKIQNGKVVWQMPLGGSESVTLTYMATPPAGATGGQWFRAAATFSSDLASQRAEAARLLEPVGSSCTLDCGATASRSSGHAPLSVQFKGTATPRNCTGRVVYEWDFGDGSPQASSQNPTHVFETAGTFTWKLTVSIAGRSCTRKGTIRVLESRHQSELPLPEP